MRYLAKFPAVLFYLLVVTSPLQAQLLVGDDTPIPGGTLLIQPQQDSYAEGDSIILLAAPDDGYAFSDWTSVPYYANVNPEANPIGFTLQGNIYTRPVFKKIVSTNGVDLKIAANDEADIVNNSFTDSLDMMDLGAFTVSLVGPGAFTFEIASLSESDARIRLSDTLDYSQNSLSEQRDQIRILIPHGTHTFDIEPIGSIAYASFQFSPGTHIEVKTHGAGQVSRTPEKSDYTPGEKVALAATPDEGWTFIRYEGDIESTQAEIDIAASSQLQITAVFGKSLQFAGNTWLVQLPESSNDPTAPNPVSIASTDDTLTFSSTATTPGATSFSIPLQGPGTFSSTITDNFDSYYSPISFKLDEVDVEPIKSDNAFHLKIRVPKGKHTLTGSFGLTHNPSNENKYIQISNTIWNPGYELTIYSAHGSVSTSPNKTFFTPGESISLTASNASSAPFDSWGGDFSSTENPLVFEIQDNTQLSALFSKKQTVDGTDWFASGDLPWNYQATEDTQSGSAFVLQNWVLGTESWFELRPGAPARVTLRYRSLGECNLNLRASDGYSNSTIFIRNEWNETTASIYNPSNPLRISTAPGYEGTIFSPIIVEIVSVEYSFYKPQIFGGQVTISPEKEYYQPGESISISATPDEFHTFSHWNSLPENTPSEATIEMQPGLALHPVFVPKQLLPNITLSGPTLDGWHLENPYEDALELVSPPTPPNSSVESEFQLQGPGVFQASLGFSSIYFTDYSLSYFLDDQELDLEWDSNSGELLTIPVDSGTHSVRIRFTHSIPDRSDIRLKINSLAFTPGYSLTDRTSGGAVQTSPSAPFPTPTSVSFTATPDYGNRFVFWSGDLQGTTPTTTKTVSSHLNLAANFSGPATFEGANLTYGGDAYFHIPDERNYLTLFGSETEDTSGWIEFELEGSGFLSFELYSPTEYQKPKSGYQITLDGTVIKEQTSGQIDAPESLYFSRNISSGTHTLRISADLLPGPYSQMIIARFNFETSHTLHVTPFITDFAGIPITVENALTIVPNKTTYAHGEHVSIKVAPGFANEYVISSIYFENGSYLEQTPISDTEVELTVNRSSDVFLTLRKRFDQASHPIDFSLGFTLSLQTETTHSGQSAIQAKGNWESWGSQELIIPAAGPAAISFWLKTPESIYLNVQSISSEYSFDPPPTLDTQPNGQWQYVSVSIPEGASGLTLIAYNSTPDPQTEQSIYIDSLSVVSGYKPNLYLPSGGSIQLTPAKASYTPNESVTVTAVPESGYTFSHWSDQSPATSQRTRTVTRPNSTYLQPEFRPTLTLNSISLQTRGNTVSLTRATPTDSTETDALTFDPHQAGDSWAEFTAQGPAVLSFKEFFAAKNYESPTHQLVVEIGDKFYPLSQDSNWKDHYLPIPSGPQIIRFHFSSTQAAPSNTRVSSRIANLAVTPGFTVTTDYQTNRGDLILVPSKSIYQQGETVKIFASPRKNYTFSAFQSPVESENPTIEYTFNDHLHLQATFDSHTKIGGLSWTYEYSEDEYSRDTYSYTATLSGPASLNLSSGYFPYEFKVYIDGQIALEWQKPNKNSTRSLAIPEGSHQVEIQTSNNLNSDAISLHSGYAVTLSNPNQPVSISPLLPAYPLDTQVTLTLDPEVAARDNIHYQWLTPATSTEPSLALTVDSHQYVELELYQTLDVGDFSFATSYPFWSIEEFGDGDNPFSLHDPYVPSWIETSFEGPGRLTLDYSLIFGSTQLAPDQIKIWRNNRPLHSISNTPTSGSLAFTLPAGSQTIRFQVFGTNEAILKNLNYQPYSIFGYESWSNQQSLRLGSAFSSSLNANLDTDLYPNWLEFLMDLDPGAYDSLTRSRMIDFGYGPRPCATLELPVSQATAPLSISYRSETSSNTWTTESLEAIEFYTAPLPNQRKEIQVPLDQFPEPNTLLHFIFEPNALLESKYQTD